MSNFHKDLNEANKHTAKGFTSGASGSACIRNENGVQEFEKPFGFPAAINFVDGNAAPPTTVNGDIYVLEDRGNGALHADWTTVPTVAYGDWVKKNTVWLPRKPVHGTICFNKANESNYYFDGTDWIVSSVTVETNLGNVLFVTINGSIVESRANALGNLNITLSPERAIDVAASGDKIVVYPGNYTLTSTATNGYAKDGVDWVFMPKAIFNKATTGAMFDTAGFTIGCSVYGDGDFYGTGSCGVIYHDALTGSIDHAFEYNICENNVNACYISSGVNTGNAKIKGNLRIVSTSNYAINTGAGTNLVSCPLIKSTSTNGLYVFGGDTTVVASEIISTGGIGLQSLNANTLSVSCGYINKATIVGVGNAALNVGNIVELNYTGGIYNMHFTGYVTTYNHTSGYTVIDGQVGQINSASGTGYIKATMAGQHGLAITGSGRLVLDLTTFVTAATISSYADISNPLAVINVYGYWRCKMNWIIADSTINIYGTIKPTTVSNFGSFDYSFYLLGGKFLVFGTIDFSEITITSNYICVWLAGAITFVSNGGTFVANNQDQIGVGHPTIIRDVKIKSLYTNLTSFLSAKTNMAGITDLIGGTLIEDADITE